MIEVKLENYDDFLRCLQSDPTQFVIVGTPYHQPRWKNGIVYLYQEGIEIWVKLTSVSQSLHSRLIYSHTYVRPIALPLSVSMEELTNEKISLRKQLKETIEEENVVVFYGSVATDVVEGE